MSYYCIFAKLPVELLHILFTYFSTCELLFTFRNISDYVNDALQSYSDYQFDFKSISKSYFRCVCRYVRPEQVISLTLSDSNDTPGQSELFFSRFQIEQFTRLRSLILIEIEFNSLKSIFISLPKLNRLRSLSFDAYSVRHTYGPLDLKYRNKFEEINSMLHNTYAQVFSRLNFLNLSGGWVLESIPLPNLLYLKLAQCPINKIERITHLAPKLRALDVCINFEHMDFKCILLPSRLTRLCVKIQDFPVSMNFLQCLLSNRFYLKHLELHVKGSNDLTDGQRWQILTKSLITFNFKFNIRLNLIKQTLDSFQTLFWLEEKQWFVAYQDEYLFSVPYFALQEVENSYQSPIHSTVPNNTIFYENVTKLNVTVIQVFNKRFTHVNILELKYFISPKQLLRFVDLSNVKHLSILSLDYLLEFTSLERTMPHLCRLSVSNEIKVQEAQYMVYGSYEQIRTLEIKINLENPNYIIEKLLYLFPRTEQFICKSDIQLIKIMVHFIDGFKHLLNASFISFGPLFNEHDNFRYNPDLMILEANRPTYGISICRIYHLSNSTSSFSINWWIEE